MFDKNGENDICQVRSKAWERLQHKTALVSSLCNHDLLGYFRMSYAPVSKCTGKYYLFQLVNTFKDLCQTIQVVTILNQILIVILYVKVKITFDIKLMSVLFRKVNRLYSFKLTFR